MTRWSRSTVGSWSFQPWVTPSGCRASPRRRQLFLGVTRHQFRFELAGRRSRGTLPSFSTRLGSLVATSPYLVIPGAGSRAPSPSCFDPAPRRLAMRFRDSGPLSSTSTASTRVRSRVYIRTSSARCFVSLSQNVPSRMQTRLMTIPSMTTLLTASGCPTGCGTFRSGCHSATRAQRARPRFCGEASTYSEPMTFRGFLLGSCA